MTMLSPKMAYAQSSDIRSRAYLEYRRDVKKKGIADLTGVLITCSDFTDAAVSMRYHYVTIASLASLIITAGGERWQSRIFLIISCMRWTISKYCEE